MDVSDGGYYYTDWDSFIRRWGYFDGLLKPGAILSVVRLSGV